MRANIQYNSDISISDFYLATYSTFSGDNYNHSSDIYTPTLDNEKLALYTDTTNITSSNRYRTIDNNWVFTGSGFSNITSVEIYATSLAVNTNNNIVSSTTPHIIYTVGTDTNNFDSSNSDTSFKFKIINSDHFIYNDGTNDTYIVAGNLFFGSTNYNSYLIRFISNGGSVATYDIKADLSNVTSDSNNPTSVNSGDSFTLVYNANTDYTITTCTSNIGTITYSNDNKTVTITGIATENISVICIATHDTISYTITNTLSNVTSDSNNPTSVNNGDSFTLVYNANTDYTITTCTSNIGTITYSNDNKTVTITGTATENISVNCVATKDTPTTQYTYQISNLINCTANKNNGDTVTLNDIFTITANEGYYFSSDTYQFLLNGYEINYFTKSSDNKTLSLTITNSYLGNIVVSDISAVLEPTETTSQFLHIYEVTNDNLSEIAKSRFYETSDGTVKDIGEYIYKLFRNYIPISDNNKSSTTTITIGNMNLTINSTDINNNLITINTSITISGLEYNNNYNCFLYLPLCDTFINIPINYVFNKVLNIHLQFELYTQNCQYELYSDDLLFDTGNYNFSCDIPYRTFESNFTVNYKYVSPIYTYCLLTIVKENILKISDITDEYINGTLLEFNCNHISNDDYNELNNIIEQGIYLT